MKRLPARTRGSAAFAVAVASALGLLGACSTTSQQSAAPDIGRVDLPAQYTQTQTTAEAGQALTSNQPNAENPVGWTQLGDPVLDTFIALALKNNQDLLIATTRTEQARAAQKREALNKLPTLDVGASASRDRASINGAQAGQPGFSRNSTTFRSDTTLNWELDLFGRQDALVSADHARAQAAAFRAQDIRLTVVSDVAKNVITARTLQARIKLAQESAATEGEIVSITRAKLRGGQISRADLLRAMALEQDSKATAARLQHDYGEAVKTLAVLLAETPEYVRLKLLVKPEAGSYASAMSGLIATGLPSDLLRRRPDIKSAEFQLAAASRDLAASHAERFPAVRWGSTLALVAGTLAKLGSLDSLLTSLGPSITWRALDFGRLDADIERAKGFEKEALIAYKKSVTTAFAEADTALGDVVRRQALVQTTAASAAAQHEAWEVVQLQYERGLTDLTTALDTKRALYRSQESSALALQEQLLAAVTVYRALGGGW